MLLYPSKQGAKKGYVPTVRIDAVRDGLETYEYLKLLESQGTPEAKGIIERYKKLAKVPNAGGRYSKLMLPKPFELGALREAAGALLDSANADK